MDELFKAEFDLKSRCSICLDLLNDGDNTNASLGINTSSNNNELISQPVMNCTHENDTTINISSIPIAVEKKQVKQHRKCCFNNKSRGQKLIMLTPCNHCFHAGCLKEWCTHKNECPICRKILPSID